MCEILQISPDMLKMNAESDSESFKSVIAEVLSGDPRRTSEAKCHSKRLNTADFLRVTALQELLLFRSTTGVVDAIERCLRDTSVASPELLDIIEVFISCVDIPCEALKLCVSILEDLVADGEKMRFRVIYMVGCLKLRLGDESGASAQFHSALGLSDSMDALLGVIECKLLTGERSEGEEKFEFLRDTQSGASENANFLFLDFKISGNVDSLNKALNVHVSTFLHVDRRSLEYVAAINSQFMYELAEALKSSGCTVRAVKVLETLLRVFPRSEKIILLLADCHEESENFDVAISVLKQGASFRTVVRLAEILLRVKGPESAMETLEGAQSSNILQVRSCCIFWVVKALLAGEDARSQIPFLLQGLDVVDEDRAELEIKLIEAYIAVCDFRKANEYLNNHVVEVDASHLCRAKVCVAQRHADAALGELERIPKASKYHQECTVLRLEIFCSTSTKKRIFRKILNDNVSKLDQLGYWYLRIGDVDAAIRCFQQCSGSTKNLAEAYLLAHRYDEAIALLEGPRLIEVLLMLHRYHDALLFIDRESSLERFHVIDAAWKWTKNREWISKGLEASVSRESMQLDVLSLSEIHAILGEWKLYDRAVHEAKEDFQVAIKLNSKNERALLGLSKTLIKENPSHALSCLYQIQSVQYKPEALSLLRNFQSSTSMPKLLDEKFIDLARNIGPELLVVACYRLDQFALLQSILGTTSTEEQLYMKALMAFWDSDEQVLMKEIDRLDPGEKRDSLIFKFLHLRFFITGTSIDSVFDKISFTNSQKYRFYFGLFFVQESKHESVAHNELAKILFDAYVCDKKRKKMHLKKLFHLVKSKTDFTEFEFTLIHTGLTALGETYFSVRNYEKAIDVLEMLCDLCRGDKHAVSKLGLCYFHKRMWAESVQSLSRSSMTHENVRYLAKSLSKGQNWKEVVELALEYGDKGWSELTCKCLNNLH